MRTEGINSSLPGKRILFGTTVGLSAQALLRGQLSWFRRRGWEVTLVSSPDAEAKRAVRREQVSFFGIPMKRDIAPIRDLKAVLDWWSLIRKVRPHVVNVGTPKASLLGNLAAWTLRVPRRIYTVRGLRLEGTSGLMSKILWAVERLTIKMATDVIAVSASLGKELVKRNLASPEDIWVIGNGSSNGVDTQSIQKRMAQIDSDRLRERLGIEPTKFVVGYIGRISRSKGFDQLLEAMTREVLRANTVLLVIGTIEDSQLVKHIEALAGRVYMVPWTEDVWGFLPAIDLLVLPSRREGFPNTVIEAAAAGIPAVTTRATGAIDSVIDGETGFLVDVGDAEALCDRIITLVRNPALRLQMGCKARRRAETRFRPQDIWFGIEAIANGQREVADVKRLDSYMEVGK